MMETSLLMKTDVVVGICNFLKVGE